MGLTDRGFADSVMSDWSEDPYDPATGGVAPRLEETR